MNMFSMYLLMKLSDIQVAASLLVLFGAIVTLVLGIITAVATADNVDSDSTISFKYTLKRCVFWTILIGVFATLIPDSKQAAIYLVPRIAESKAIQQDIPELYNMAVDRLKYEITNGVTNVEQ